MLLNKLYFLVNLFDSQRRYSQAKLAKDDFRQGDKVFLDRTMYTIMAHSHLTKNTWGIRGDGFFTELKGKINLHRRHYDLDDVAAALNNAETEGGNRILNVEQRWPLDVELLVNEPDWPISIPENEVLEAERDISNNIKPRDFKLIDNSIFTTVYRKNYGGRSEGVNAEIQYTISRMKKPYVYDPKEDSDPRIPHPFNPEELIYNDNFLCCYLPPD